MKRHQNSILRFGVSAGALLAAFVFAGLLSRCSRAKSLSEEEAAKVQNLVTNGALGGLYNSDLESLERCGWVQGQIEYDRIAGDPARLLNTGLRGELRAREYIVRKILIRPGRTERCVVLALPQFPPPPTTAAKVDPDRPYAFLVEKEEGEWTIRVSAFLPTDIVDLDDPWPMFVFLEGIPQYWTLPKTAQAAAADDSGTTSSVTPPPPSDSEGGLP